MGPARGEAGRRYSVFGWSGPSNAENCLLVFGADAGLFSQAVDDAGGSTGEYARLGIITPRLYRPWLGRSCSRSYQNLSRGSPCWSRTAARWPSGGPTLLDVLTSVKSSPSGVQRIVGHEVGFLTRDTVGQTLRDIWQNLTSIKPIQNLVVGAQEAPRRKLATAWSSQSSKRRTRKSSISSSATGCMWPTL